MSTRQKSFFDQDHRPNKPHPRYFNRSRAKDAGSAGNPPKKEPVTKLPIMPSTQTRKKLKAFQFIDGVPTATLGQVPNEKDKENEPIKLKENVPQRPCQQTPLKSVGTSNAPGSASKGPPPSTPITRLPLADLLGNPDETFKRKLPTNISPEERILWMPAASPNTSQPKTTPARSRKRAKSSSPISSSQNEASRFFPEHNAGQEGATIQHVLKTPQADPAVALWNRYAINGTAKDSAVLANLIRDPSPKSSAAAGSVSGLRRWASCGIEWPTSRSKRRKMTNGTARRPADDQPHDGKVTKSSKVSDLLERMKETLARPNEDMPQGPSSSSPLLEAGGTTDATSPLQRLAPISETPPRPSHTAQKRQTQQHQDFEKRLKMSSDYGDLDVELFDAAVLETSCMAHTPAQQRLLEQPRVGGNTSALPQPAAASGPLRRVQQPRAPAPATTNASESFGSDDDLFAADLEVLASKYDSQASAPVLRPSLPRVDRQVDISRSPQTTYNDQNLLQSLDEFGEDDIDVDQFVAVEAMVSQQYLGNGHAQAQGPSEKRKRAIQRYLVKMIHEEMFKDDSDREQIQKILVVEEEKTKIIKVILLRQSWFETPVTVGSYVHIIGDFSSSGQCVVDNSSNMVIVHPDHLISSTTVADSFGCMRRAVLQDRVKATSDANPPLLYGSILHELFQEAVKANRWDGGFLEEALEAILPRHYETMVAIGLNLNQVNEHIMSRVPEMQGWAEIFLRAKPRSDATVKARGGKSVTVAIKKLLDVEEHVWSPMYGLKGNIDATVQAVIQEDGQEKVLTVPFEVKTGKKGSESHVAQTALYTLLLSDRYDIDISYGLLYYLERSEVNRIEAVRHELIHMVMKRNELACYVRERLSLPPVLRNSHLCGRCYAQTTCLLYHKLAEDGVAETAPAQNQFIQLIKHLKSNDQSFFQKWDNLLTKEEKDMMRFRRELWTMLSHEREKLGRCFSTLIIEPGSAVANEEASKINRYLYTMVKQTAMPTFSFAESQIAVGEPIVISDEEGHFALANGYVTSVSKRRIRVAVDRRLHNARIRQPGFDSQTNQDFAAIMEVDVQKKSPAIELDGSTQQEPVLYRLDKDEFSNGMATVRNNLLQIMDNSVFRAADLRSLIIDDRQPRFKPMSSAYPLHSQSQGARMNSDQKAAIEKVMTAEEYALVLGMPGTGKTTTIAHIIRALVAKGKSVLLTSYTHTAVDNILLKIKNAGFDILRLGVVAKIHSEVQDFATLGAQPKDTLEQLRDSWHKPPVVATTCLGLNHPLFSQRTFDVCIVDEASQVTLPVCLGPIRMAKSFVLVGDHYQLPPLVQNKEALEGGLDMSLFRLLSERHPEAVVSLEHQYRMCEDVMVLANDLVYNGRLKCGNADVAKRALELSKRDMALKKHHYASTGSQLLSPMAASAPLSTCHLQHSSDCHLNTVLNPTNKVVFLNTDAFGESSREILHGNRITNALEVALTAQLTYLLVAAGLAPNDLGIITFYRSQLALMRQALKSQPSLELHTADKFQGRDKEAIVVSFVRNNDAGEVGELLKDWRRVNVAITRARSKLILIGSKKTLMAGGDVLRGLVRICDEHGWMVNLPPGALDAHYFPEMLASSMDVTQGSPAAAGKAKGVVSPVKVPRKDGSKGSPLRSSQAAAGAQAGLAAAGLKRKPLGAVDGNTGKRPMLQKPFKVPEKVGRVNTARVLKSRHVLNDVLNELM